MWSYNYGYYDELRHYGIKGMRWGVRRTKKELLYDKGSIQSIINKNASSIIASNGLLIRSISIHAVEQAHNRNVSAKSIIDSLKNPLQIREPRIDQLGRKSQRFIGYSATVNVNPDTGVISTVWPTGTATRTRLSKKGVD